MRFGLCTGGQYVCVLATSDPNVVLGDGFRAGMTYREVRDRLPNAEVQALPGYGVMVNIMPNTWIGYFQLRGNPPPDLPAKWIELREKPPFDSMR